MKKKIIVSLLITGLFIFGLIKTNGYTYLGGELQPMPALIFFVAVAVVYIIILLCIFGSYIKKYANKQKMVPFRELKN